MSRSQLIVFSDIPRSCFLVDSGVMDTYDSVGLTNIGEKKELSEKGMKNFKIPNLTMNQVSLLWMWR